MFHPKDLTPHARESLQKSTQAPRESCFFQILAGWIDHNRVTCPTDATWERLLPRFRIQALLPSPRRAKRDSAHVIGCFDLAEGTSPLNWQTFGTFTKWRRFPRLGAPEPRVVHRAVVKPAPRWLYKARTYGCRLPILLSETY